MIPRGTTFCLVIIFLYYVEDHWKGSMSAEMCQHKVRQLIPTKPTPEGICSSCAMPDWRHSLPLFVSLGQAKEKEKETEKKETRRRTFSGSSSFWYLRSFTDTFIRVTQFFRTFFFECFWWSKKSVNLRERAQVISFLRKRRAFLGIRWHSFRRDDGRIFLFSSSFDVAEGGYAVERDILFHLIF